MLCYKDMAFCQRIECKKFGVCARSLTDAVARDAEQLGLLVSVMEFDCVDTGEDDDE